MLGKMNLDLKLLYCEFQKFEAVVGGQPKKKKKKNAQVPVLKQENTSNALF